MSDGYIADYVFNADGTGRAKITGPDPGLPVTIVWDAYGATTITYADGSTEFYPGWYAIGTPIPVDGGVAVGSSSGSSGSGTNNSGATTVSSPPSTPVTGI